MGKDSLLKSTSKKKPKAKAAKGKAAKKVAAKKSKAKAKPKGRLAKKAMKTAAKAPAKVTKAVAKKKAPAAKKPPQKLTRKELLFKKFDSPPATALYSPPASTQDAGGEAPSYFTGMSDAAAAKEALQRKFNWDEIKAAGVQYAARMAAEDAKRKAEEDAKRKAEEDAKRKAEEDAQRKAEEDAQRKAEEDAQRKAEEDAQRKAEEDAQRKAEAEAEIPPPGVTAPEAAASKPMKFGLIGFGVVLLLLIMTSYTNTKKYYITEKDGAVIIARGTFTPMGTTVLMTMKDVTMPEPVQEVYGWQDAYRLMYQHYINAADNLLEAPGVPDAAALATQLGMAVKYAPNRELREDARSRLVGMRVQLLVHKAQAAMQRRTIEGAQAALEFLDEAAGLDPSKGEEALLQERTAEAEKLLADLEAAKAEAERQAAEEAALAAEAEKLKATAATSQPEGTDAD
jgi:hypothetical protein